MRKLALFNVTTRKRDPALPIAFKDGKKATPSIWNNDARDLLHVTSLYGFMANPESMFSPPGAPVNEPQPGYLSEACLTTASMKGARLCASPGGYAA